MTSRPARGRTRIKGSATVTAEALRTPARTYGYVRVSTDRQAEEGQSLEVQEQAIRGWAQMFRRELHEIVQEPGVSGSVAFAKRPAGGLLFRELQRGDTVVAWKLDRMFRSTSDCLHVAEEFQRRGVSLHLLDISADDVSGNGVAKLFISIMSAVAEFERGRIRERIVAAKVRHKAEGKHLGGERQFGFEKVTKGTKGAKLVPIEAEQRELRRIHQLAAQGWSSHRIKADLASRGHPLSHVTIRKIILAGPARQGASTRRRAAGG
jgi:DNA invertase Pin-like site-specific DNA recombinase